MVRGSLAMSLMGEPLVFDPLCLFSKKTGAMGWGRVEKDRSDRGVKKRWTDVVI